MRITDNSLIFIDEFDATKENILNIIIESGMKHRINLLDLFLNIHNHLMQNECPESLLQESEYRKQIQENKSRKWLSPREQIESFKEKTEQIFQKYKLQHTCKSHEKFSTDKRNFLFYDYHFHNVLDAHNKRIEIIQDYDNRANWINAVDFENTVRGIDIRTLLSEISGFLSYYQRGISYIADNYRHLKNEHDAIQEAFPLESAVRTTLNHFRLDGTDVEFLCKNIMEGEMPYVGHEDRYAIQRQNFYETGFRYHDIIDSEEHDTLSKIYMYNFSQTPESFLSGICTKALVVGISATAGLYTNIGNYDLEYLKSRLGKSFIRLDGEDLQRLKINFEETTKGYEQVELKIKFIDSGSREESIALLEVQLGDRLEIEKQLLLYGIS
ncbi:conserved hypothetical protein [Candidatus Methylobacter favarea]|uniref:Uncharacterized protein n=1 Tax=Candidatus Methylobacter favarea TaxID=2707345 RepID=A0A8S0X9U0_9GAMM|nr:hypothetical protein [Candidatus Methylobacter favarea]CAA9892666.1 conserved hypothetical protein [Candidatus Methylobacter favarea]